MDEILSEVLFLIMNIFILLLIFLINNLFADFYRDNNSSEDYSISAFRVGNGIIKVNGVLNEESWSDADSIDGLIQCEPTFGVPASEKTTAKVLYNYENIYVGVVCYYKDIDDLIADKLSHRDTAWDDQLYFILDTFQDHRKGYCFGCNALGAKDE